jgi:hypothetical protein
MKQASFGLLISYRGSLIQACFIFLGFAPVPSLFFAETNNPIFLGMKEPTIPSDEGALSGSERVFVKPPASVGLAPDVGRKFIASGAVNLKLLDSGASVSQKSLITTYPSKFTTLLETVKQ